MDAPQRPLTRRMLRPEDFDRLDERLALNAALDLMSAELLVCRDQDEYLSLVAHRNCIKKIRQRLEEEQIEG